MRRFGLRDDQWERIKDLLPGYRKQEPTGYSNSSQEWMNSAGLLARMNFALQLANGKMPGVKVDTANAAKPDESSAGIALGSPEFQKK